MIVAKRKHFKLWLLHTECTTPSEREARIKKVVALDRKRRERRAMLKKREMEYFQKLRQEYQARRVKSEMEKRMKKANANANANVKK